MSLCHPDSCVRCDTEADTAAVYTRSLILQSLELREGWGLRRWSMQKMILWIAVTLFCATLSATCQVH